MEDDEQIEADLGSPLPPYSALDHFEDASAVATAFDSLPSDSGTLNDIDDAQERMKTILDRYQEQPHLLDPHLHDYFSQLSHHFPSRLDDDDPHKRMKMLLAAKYMRLMTKVRGFKTIIRHLPHEVKDLPRALYLVSAIDWEEASRWEVRYMLLLWLSIASQVPFSLSLLDAQLPSMLSARASPPADAVPTSTSGYIIFVAEYFLRRSEKTQDAAAFLVGKVLSRPDTSKQCLEATLDRCFDVLERTCWQPNDALEATAVVSGCLLEIASIFKLCPRSALLPHARAVLERIRRQGLLTRDTQVRRLYAKAIQRIGLCFLRISNMNWRYRHQPRRLMQESSSSSSKPKSKVLAVNGLCPENMRKWFLIFVSVLQVTASHIRPMGIFSVEEMYRAASKIRRRGVKISFMPVR